MAGLSGLQNWVNDRWH